MDVVYFLWLPPFKHLRITTSCQQSPIVIPSLCHMLGVHPNAHDRNPPSWEQLPSESKSLSGRCGLSSWPRSVAPPVPLPCHLRGVQKTRCPLEYLIALLWSSHVALTDSTVLYIYCICIFISMCIFVGAFLLVLHYIHLSTILSTFHFNWTAYDLMYWTILRRISDIKMKGVSNPIKSAILSLLSKMACGFGTSVSIFSVVNLNDLLCNEYVVYHVCMIPLCYIPFGSRVRICTDVQCLSWNRRWGIPT